MRGSDFAELKAFAAVVERASFARAAEHLGLSASALSQTVRRLETRLGARLLNRTTRSVAPTSVGTRLYERIMPMMQEMDAAVAEAVEATGRTAGTLRINTLGMAAQKLIAPRLGRFHRSYPQVVLDIVVDDGLTDIVAGRFDAGIRVGERLEKDMIAVRLTADVKMTAVASPDYLKQYGVPKTPADLHRHTCINWRMRYERHPYLRPALAPRYSSFGKLLVSCGALQAFANSPTLAFFDKHTRSQGPSLHRRYPASTVL